MTLTETGQVMDVLTVAYPQFYRRQSAEERAKALMLWASMFETEDVELVVGAVKALVCAKEDDWPPSIGAVKAKLRLLTQPEEMTEAEAWGLVRKAIGRSAYESKREFEALPPMLRRLVGEPSQLRDWAMMDEETVASVVASNFQRSYRARAQSAREYEALPPSVKALVGAVSGRFALTEGGGTHA